MVNNSLFSFKEVEQMELPPGFRFHPTDDELITHYLTQKVLDNCFCARAIGEVDLNKCEPWDLPMRAKMGEKEWYFFCVRDRKYPTGLRTNRATDAGYWKATGKDKEIYKAKALIGMKKTLVFYKGRAPKGEKSNWVMHEYRLEGKYSVFNLPKAAKNEWVICRIFKKSANGKKTHISGLMSLNSKGNELRQSILPPLMDSSPNNSQRRTNIGDASHVTCFSKPMENQRTHEPMVADSFNTCHLAASSSSNMSPASVLFSKTSPQNAFYSSQISQGLANMQHPDSFLTHDQSPILRMLLENLGPNNVKPNSNSSRRELSQDTNGLRTDMSSVVTNHEFVQRSFEDQEDPSSCGAGPVDLDCLWSY